MKADELAKGVSQAIQDGLVWVHSVHNIPDEIIKPVTDYTDTIGNIEDMFSPIKVVMNINRHFQKWLFLSFLKSCSQVLESGETLSATKSKKLEEYLSRSSNAAIVNDMIESLLKAKSIKAASMLGLLLGQKLNSGKDFNHEDITIIDALRVANDLDLILLEKIINYAQDTCRLEDKEGDFMKEEFRIWDFFRELEKYPSPPFEQEEAEIVIEKFKRTGMLRYGRGGIGSLGDAYGSFSITNQCMRLLELSNSF